MTTATRIYSRAPKGGMVSPVNGRFYKGGQFIPAATIAAKDEWVVRPTSVTGARRYLAVAKLASGEEVVCDRPSFATVREARLYIISRYDGGRKFPAPARKTWTIDVAAIDRIRFAHRGC